LLHLLLALALQKDDLARHMEKDLAHSPLNLPGFEKDLALALRTVGAKLLPKLNGITSVLHTWGDTRGIIAYAEFKEPNPSAGAGIVFIWPEGGKNHVAILNDPQYAEDFNLGQTYWKSDRLVIAGSKFPSDLMPPEVDVYRKYGAIFKNEQHLEGAGEDGEAYFARLHNAVDPSRLLVITAQKPQHLSYEFGGLALENRTYWMLKGDRYEYGNGGSWTVDTALGQLDKLAGYVQKGEDKDFNSRVPLSYQTKLWNALKTKPLVKRADNAINVFDGTCFKLGKHGPALRFQKKQGQWQIVSWVDHV
jgi:hypothetical protein